MNGIKAFDLKDADEAILKKIFLLNMKIKLELLTFQTLDMPSQL